MSHLTRQTLVTLVGATLVTACKFDPQQASPDAPPVPTAHDAAVEPERFLRCTGRALTLEPSVPWRNQSSAAIADAVANHSAKDAVQRPEDAVRLAARFQYGPFLRDLGDEEVSVWFDRCGTDWEALGTVLTDADGYLELDVAGPLKPGVYETRFIVRGDQTQTHAQIWILPEGTRLFVADIDGTLTTSDGQLIQQLLDGSHVPTAYPGAADLTAAMADRGWVMVYLTGRPFFLSRITRGWLADQGIAPGPSRLTDQLRQSFPSEAGVGTFKRTFLEGLLAAGYIIDGAYGNADTDIYAYLGAGIPASNVWIIGKHAGEQGTQPVTGSWEQRAAEVKALPDVVQPFAW